MKRNIVFDIDSCMAEAIRYNPEKYIEELRNEFGEKFTDELIIDAHEYAHRIFPGFYALWQWLHQQDINIMVFSTGIKERNEELISKMVEKSFQTLNKEDRPHIKVFSRDDTIDTERIHPRENRKEYQSFWFGNQKEKTRRCSC